MEELENSMNGSEERPTNLKDEINQFSQGSSRQNDSSDRKYYHKKSKSMYKTPSNKPTNKTFSNSIYPKDIININK